MIATKVASTNAGQLRGLSSRIYAASHWERGGIAYLPYFPLGAGKAPADRIRLAIVAGRHQATSAQVALAWLPAIQQATLAIPGTGSLDHLTENVSAADLRPRLLVAGCWVRALEHGSRHLAEASWPAGRAAVYPRRAAALGEGSAAGAIDVCAASCSRVQTCRHEDEVSGTPRAHRVVTG